MMGGDGELVTTGNDAPLTGDNEGVTCGGGNVAFGGGDGVFCGGDGAFGGGDGVCGGGDEVFGGGDEDVVGSWVSSPRSGTPSTTLFSSPLKRCTIRRAVVIGVSNKWISHGYGRDCGFLVF